MAARPSVEDHAVTLNPQADPAIARWRRHLALSALQWWVWPLPPAGPLEFICQWPVYGIGETRVGIDGQVILDAARRSVQLWPEDG
jgi:hypothetical protein